MSDTGIYRECLGNLLVALVLTVCGCHEAESQSAIHISESHVAFAGAIRISGGIPSADNKNFTCAQGSWIKDGSQFAASGSWSMDTDSVDVDGRSADVPTIAMLPCSDGSSLCVFPAVLTATVDMKAGRIINSDGLDIETTHDVKIGDRITVFRVGSSAFVSIGKDEPSAKPELTKPWFIAVKHVTRIKYRGLALEAWRAEWHSLLYR
jgi:hypothetical protein